MVHIIGHTTFELGKGARYVLAPDSFDKYLFMVMRSATAGLISPSIWCKSRNNLQIGEYDMLLLSAALLSVSTLITIIVFLAVVGIVWWAINEFQLPQPFRIAAIAIAAIVAIIYLLKLAPGG